MSKVIVVKPVGDKWGVYSTTEWDDLKDDLQRFGVKIFLYNAAWLIVHKIKKVIYGNRKYL